MPDSSLDWLLSLPPEQLAAEIAGLPADEVFVALLDAYPWRELARADQLAPADHQWLTWLILAGRGWGKTRCGAEWVRQQADAHPGCRVALIGRTAADVRDVMITGESGLLAVYPPHQRPHYEPSKRLVTFHNGAIATAYSADEPDLLRGPQHHFGWCDELAAWRYPEAWDQFQLGLRLGAQPRAVVTTTPRPTRVVRELVADPTTRVTSGRTYDNAANLAASFLRQVERRYAGTRLGRQELDGVLLLDNPGALWTHAMLERVRMPREPDPADPARTTVRLPGMRRVVVAIDPAVTSDPDSDETGIVAVGLGVDGRGYVLEDASGIYTPDGWAGRALDLYDAHHADAIVGEVNQGGDMVEHTVAMAARDRKRTARFKQVRATRGKQLRAEPVAALYEQGRVSHAGVFAALEDQLTSWDATADARSPDRLDALVWALTELFVLAPPPAAYSPAAARKSRWRT